MKQQRNIGVTEAGLGLAVILCLLVAIGFFVLHTFGGTGKAPPIEIRPDFSAEAPPSAEPPGDEQQPQVLTVESSEPPGHALRSAPIEGELR
jgi:hypothetical protein